MQILVANKRNPAKTINKLIGSISWKGQDNTDLKFKSVPAS